MPPIYRVERGFARGFVPQGRSENHRRTDTSSI